MSTTINRINAPNRNGVRTAQIAYQNASIPFTMDWTQFNDSDICAALYGTATAVTALVERSATDPFNTTAEPVGVDGTSFSGDLATGIVPNIYQETGIGWWRIRVTAVSGGTCSASLSGF